MSSIASFLTQNKRPTTPHFSVEGGNVIVDGETRLTSFSVAGTGCVLGPDGKYYFTAKGMASANRDVFVYKYNSETNEIEQEFRITVGYVHYDSHRFGAIDVDGDGNIYVAFEDLHSTDTHGGPIHIWKTATPGDLSTMREIKRLPGRWSYVHIKVNGSNVFVEARGSTSEIDFVRDEIWYFNSTDGGATFGSAVKLYDSLDADLPAYVFHIPDQSDPSKICIVLNERSNITATWGFVAVFRGSVNSNVWTNYEGDFSKDVSGSGAITRTEARSDCMVVDGVADHDINLDGGMIKPNGDIKLLLLYQEQTENEYVGNRENELIELRLYFYASGWDFNEIDIPAGMVYYWAYQRPAKYVVQDESFEDVYFIDRTNNNNVYRKRSTDDFASNQTDTLILTGNGKHKTCQPPQNISNDEDQLLIVSWSPSGDEFELGDSEEPEDYSNILLLKL